MTPEEWQRVKEIVAAAVELPDSARQAFLENACGGDSGLLEEARSLLNEDVSRLQLFGGWLEDDDSGPSPLIGRRLGAYQILEEIGRGGMGAVYRAVRADRQYEGDVAIKVLRRGAADQELQRRFRIERQILAALHHPNIATLLDAGRTDDGQPYFVMEFVKAGLRIDEYCRRRHLSLPDRLRLFRVVCDAVHHAHQNLVIHRDLKPQNILVTPDGTVKLLDFGVGKVIDSNRWPSLADITQSHVLILTPAYASPEQVRGETVTTATDIYSLGVILYELLAGEPPYQVQGKSRSEVEKIISEQEPRRPSLRLPEDLNAIVSMTLRKEPSARYGSVQQMSEDIGRYLDARPVIARKNTVRYAAARFIKRNRPAVGAAAIILFMLLASLTATIWEARIAETARIEAERQRARAERRFNEVRTLANSFLFDFHDAIQDLSGATEARVLVVKKALEYLSSLSADAEDDPSLLRELALAYERVGDVQGEPNDSNIGDSKGAIASYDTALRLWRNLERQGPSDEQSLIATAGLLRKRGDIAASAGDFNSALHQYRESLGVLQHAPADSRRVQIDTMAVTARIGSEMARQGDVQTALEFCLRALESGRGIAFTAEDEELPHNTAIAYSRIALVFFNSRDFARALEAYEHEMEITEALVEKRHRDRNTHFRRDLGLSYMDVGKTMVAMGRRSPGLAYLKKSHGVLESLAADDPASLQFSDDLAKAYSVMSDALEQIRDFAGAVEYRQKDIGVTELAAAKHPGNTHVLRGLSYSYHQMGLLLEELKRTREALAYYDRDLRIASRMLEMEPDNDDFRGRLIVRYTALADTYQKLGQLRTALELYRKGLTVAEKYRRTEDAAGLAAKIARIESPVSSR